MVIPIDRRPEDGADDADYSGVSATVTFASGRHQSRRSPSGGEDTADDDGETVALGFGTPPTGVTAGTPSTTTVSITDDDDPAVTVMFGASAYTAAEGGQVEVAVTLSADPERTVVVPIEETLEGGASSSADYSGVSSTVTFASGDTSQTITFMAAADADNDDGEGVKLSFGGTLPAGVTAGTPNGDDGEHHRRRRPGGDRDVRRLRLHGGRGRPGRGHRHPERRPGAHGGRPHRGDPGGRGELGADYSGVPSNVTFASGDTSQTITFMATADADNDDGEGVKLSFGTPLPAGVTAGTPSATTVSITDDDDPAVTVMFGASAYTAAEGGQVEVTVTLSADPERTVVVPIVETLEGGATSGDYSGVILERDLRLGRDEPDDHLHGDGRHRQRRRRGRQAQLRRTPARGRDGGHAQRDDGEHHRRRRAAGRRLLRCVVLHRRRGRPSTTTVKHRPDNDDPAATTLLRRCGVVHRRRGSKPSTSRSSSTRTPNGPS